MKAAVVVFPGANCDRDLAVALRAAGFDVSMHWWKDRELPQGLDVVGLPGGFSFGDYLRCGAIAARAPAMDGVRAHAARGGLVLGICNGFQALIEAGLLPGALMRNAGLKFVCRTVGLEAAGQSPFTLGMPRTLRLPVAHHDGCFVADGETLARLKGEGRVAFRYAPGENPNGSMEDVAGVLSENRRVLGLMPHPERAADPALGAADGAALFAALAGAGAPA